jgi:DNA-binding GntR family transcriptional regulator
VHNALLRTMRADLVKIIRDGLLANKYRPGTRIKEEEISAEMGISRTPIREALVVLEQQGLVVQKPHRGTFVATFTPEEVIDLLRVEEALDSLAASLAAQNIAIEQIQAMRDLTREAESALTAKFDSEKLYEYDRTFHYRLVEGSGSRVISRIVEVQFAQIYLCRYYTITAPNRFVHSIREHEEILNFLEKRDSAGAEAAARKHLQSVIADYKSAQMAGGDANGT